jgi:hypothetical protein
MGLFSHIVTFGAGIYIGMHYMKPDSNGSLVRVDAGGLRLGSTDIVRITPQRVEIFEGSFKIDRKDD